MVFNKSMMNIGETENTYGAYEAGTIRIFWYAGGGIHSMSLSASGETVAAAPQVLPLYCDQYAFGPDCTVTYDDNNYKIQGR
ncbi:hypothetical protein FACS1894211_04340 [Clostridia bacterium]|nr:hypothetical protein FACS1894211_04340 [Clostridia bacterium]